MRIPQTALIACFLLGWTSFAVATETLGEGDLPGQWEKPEPVTIKAKLYEWLFSREPMRLNIDSDLNVVFTRLYKGSELVSEANRSTIQFVDETIIIALDDGNKLVVSGWATSGEKLLFGQLLIRKSGSVVNGIPVSFSTEA